jgi:hypothetical protein
MLLTGFAGQPIHPQTGGVLKADELTAIVHDGSIELDTGLEE